MLPMKYTAYIDGSHHTKSKTSGWGFAILSDDKLIHESYGSVPAPWILAFEYYAFAKLVQFCIENKINDVLMRTDLLGMEKQYTGHSALQIVEEAQKYVLIPAEQTLNLKVEYISRKKNTLADKLSRVYLMTLYQQERDKFLDNHGQPGSTKVNFLHVAELLHSSRTMLKSTQSRVLHAVKKNHLIFELFAKTNILRILWNRKKGHQEILETISLNDNAENVLLDKMYEYSHQNKNLLLMLEDRSLYDQLTGIKENKLSHELNTKFQTVLDNVKEVFLHHCELYPVKKKNRKRDSTFRKGDLESPALKPLILEKAKTQDKFFKIVMSWDVQNFTTTNSRRPTVQERNTLAQKRRELLGIKSF